MVTTGEELTLWIDLLNQPLVFLTVFQVCEAFYIKYRTKTAKEDKNADSDSLHELKKYIINLLQYSEQRNKQSGSRESAPVSYKNLRAQEPYRKIISHRTL